MNILPLDTPNPSSAETALASGLMTTGAGGDAPEFSFENVLATSSQSAAASRSSIKVDSATPRTARAVSFAGENMPPSAIVAQSATPATAENSGLSNPQISVENEIINGDDIRQESADDSGSGVAELADLTGIQITPPVFLLGPSAIPIEPKTSSDRGSTPNTDSSITAIGEVSGESSISGRKTLKVGDLTKSPLSSGRLLGFESHEMNGRQIEAETQLDGSESDGLRQQSQNLQNQPTPGSSPRLTRPESQNLQNQATPSEILAASGVDIPNALLEPSRPDASPVLFAQPDQAKLPARGNNLASQSEAIVGQPAVELSLPTIELAKDSGGAPTAAAINDVRRANILARSLPQIRTDSMGGGKESDLKGQETPRNSALDQIDLSSGRMTILTDRTALGRHSEQPPLILAEGQDIVRDGDLTTAPNAPDPKLSDNDENGSEKATLTSLAEYRIRSNSNIAQPPSTERTPEDSLGHGQLSRRSTLLQSISSENSAERQGSPNGWNAAASPAVELPEIVQANPTILTSPVETPSSSGLLRRIEPQDAGQGPFPARRKIEPEKTGQSVVSVPSDSESISVTSLPSRKAGQSVASVPSDSLTAIAPASDQTEKEAANPLAENLRKPGTISEKAAGELARIDLRRTGRPELGPASREAKIPEAITSARARHLVQQAGAVRVVQHESKNGFSINASVSVNPSLETKGDATIQADNPDLDLGEKRSSQSDQRALEGSVVSSPTSDVRGANESPLLRVRQNELTTVRAKAEASQERVPVEAGAFADPSVSGGLGVEARDKSNTDRTADSPRPSRLERSSSRRGIVAAQHAEHMASTIDIEPGIEVAGKNMPNSGKNDSLFSARERILPAGELPQIKLEDSGGRLRGGSVLANQLADPAERNRFELEVAASHQGRDPVQARLSERIWSAIESFRATSSNDWVVQIRPDQETELNLRLKLQDNQLVIHARLENGNWDAVARSWPDLQAQLADRGVQLRPLEADGSLRAIDQSFNPMGSDANDPRNSRNQHSENPEFREVDRGIMTAVAEPKKASPRATANPAGKGWERWA